MALLAAAARLKDGSCTHRSQRLDTSDSPPPPSRHQHWLSRLASSRPPRAHTRGKISLPPLWPQPQHVVSTSRRQITLPSAMTQTCAESGESQGRENSQGHALSTSRANARMHARVLVTHSEKCRPGSLPRPVGSMPVPKSQCMCTVLHSTGHCAHQLKQAVVQRYAKRQLAS